MRNLENKFELEMTNEPNLSGEWTTTLPDTTDWSTLADVPFAGDVSATDSTDFGVTFEPLSDGDIGGV